MELPTYFEDFLQNTAPTPRQKEVMIAEHKRLRERLMEDPHLRPVLLATFIQGSQRRFTANRGSTQHQCDVDVVAVTNLPRSTYTAAYAHHLFQPFLERHYAGRYEAQDRSWCITVDPEVTIDLVPTSEPDSRELREALQTKALRDWDAQPGSPQAGGAQFRTLSAAVLESARADRDFDKSEPLWIPDRTLQVWEKTHPLFLIGWTARKNEATGGHFIHVARATKWWRREIAPLPKYPKGYTLEHLVGECCADGIDSVAAGLSGTLEEMERRYAPYARRRETPFLPARGVRDPLVDVMRRVSGDDFAGFHEKLVVASDLAKRALEAATIDESSKLWRQLLGPEFPEPPSKTSAFLGGFTQPSAPARPREGRFA
ncbi:MAG: nucleotidyltransferase [Thermoanaerobaculia bacterium]